MPPGTKPICDPCPRCGTACRSDRACREASRRAGGRRGRSRLIVLTPAGWARSKYGRDPRKETVCP
jgi:hypothetical protein